MRKALGPCRRRAGSAPNLESARHVGVERRARPRAALRDQLGQVVIGLRADDDVDARRAARDLRALGLGDAAGDRDHRRGPRSRFISRPMSE